MSGEGDTRSAVALRQAEERGCVIVLPKADELQVDIDSKASMRDFRRVAKILRKHLRFTYRGHRSPSGEPWHFHVTVTLDRDVKGSKERVALQTLFGSDRVREALSY